MSDRITKTGKTAMSVFLSVTTAVWLTGSAFLVPATAYAQSITAAQLIELLIAAGVIAPDKADAARAVLVATPDISSSSKCTFTRSLNNGVTGEDVKCLQQYLNSAGFTVSATGAGAAGSETTYFGSRTTQAVAAWQAANGVAPAVGYFGPISQAKYSALMAVVVPPPDTTPPPVGAGTGLSVSAGTQPVSTLAPQSAINVPFTRVNFTASSDGDVKVTSVVIERTGLLDDSAFSGVILLDENGDRIGTSKTLNSSHQATLTTPFTVKAGQTRAITIAGDMAASISANQEGYLTLVAVNSAANVNGTFPIVGAKHRTSTTVSLGTVTLARGPLDPNGAQSKEVGTKSYIFSSLKGTAGSNENVIWKSIRFNQSGSVSSSDLANVVVKDQDGNIYPTTISDDGKYYLANFGAGLLIKKGENKEVYIQGDIEDGSARTIAFDLYKLEDARFNGVDTKYDIRPTQGTGLQATDPRYDASVVTVSAGSLRAEKSNTVSAQNILAGGTQLPLGAFTFEARGEPVSFTQWVLTVTTTNGSVNANKGEPTSITVYDENGATVAGPTDVTGTTVTLSDTITIPVGTHTYSVKGNLDSNWQNSDTIYLSFTPSTGLSSVTGDLTSNTITPTPATTVAGPTMTVKSGQLTVTPSGNFSSQTIIRGATGVKLAEFTADASQSGDDLKVTSAQFRKTVSGVTGNTVNSLVLKDGDTQLNTGSNVKNPSGNTENLTLTLDNALIIPKGTTKTLTLYGNISTTATSGGTFKFDFSAGSPDWSVTTSVQGTSVSESLSTNAGATITVGVNGGYTVTIDSSAPGEKWYAAGAKGVTLNVLRFTGSAEELALTDLRLQIDTTGSSTAGDFAAIELWSGSTLVVRKDSPSFSGGVEDFILSDTSCATAAANCFVIPKNSFRLMTVKVDLGSIGTDLSGTSGEYIGVDFDGADSTKQKATGKQSSASVHSSTAADTAGTGVVMFRTVPTLKRIALTETALTSGNIVLYKFSVTADPAYDLALSKVMFKIATTGVSALNSANFTLYNITDDNKRFGVATTASPAHIGSYDTSNELLVRVYADTTDYTSAWVTIPAGTTSTFELRGDVTTDGTSDSISTKLLGDEARTHRVSLTGASRILMAKLTRVDTDRNTTGGVVSYGSSTAANIASSSSFIWTDFSSDATTTHSAATADWSNGFKIPGLLSTGLDSSTLSN